MTILVTGGTGTIGSQVLSRLQGKGAEIRALTRSPEKARLVAGVTPVKGDLGDIDSVRAALAGVSTLFLLAPNVADELTQAMLALNAARTAGIRGVVYLSVIKSEEYANVPHFIGKYAVERMIGSLDLPATVLRPAYFIQNDLRQKDSLLGRGVYDSPIGDKGVSMVDTRDIGEAAAVELLRRERAGAPLGREVYELVGPDCLSGAAIAALWSEALGRPVRCGADGLEAIEKRMRMFLPAWHAYDLRLMYERYHEDGAAATPSDLQRLTRLLGHPPRSYPDFAKACAAEWAKS